MKPLAVEVAAPHIGAWQHGAGGESYIHERHATKPGPEVLVTALMHGNEYSGAIAVSELLASGWHPACGRVTFAFCNLAAFERFDVLAPDDSRFVDEDMNRVWYAERLASRDTSVELVRARQLLPYVQRATHLLDLHSMHEPALPLLVTGTLQRNIDFAQSLQTSCQAIIDTGHADGVRMRDHGEFSNPDGQRIALLLEAGQHWQISSVKTARDTLMRFMVQAGCLAKADVLPGWLLPDSTPPAPVQVTDRVVAQSMDFAFTQPFVGGEVIAKSGTVIAVDAGHAIVTPYDNCMLVMPSVRQLRPGVTTVRLGKMLQTQ